MKGLKTGGRKKGSPNKVTADVRAAVGMFVNGNAHRLQTWLDAVAAGRPAKGNRKAVPPDPEKAFTLFQSVIEYHVPKLARTDLTSGGKPLPRTVAINVSGR